MRSRIDQKTFTILKKIDMSYAEQHIQKDKMMDDSWPLLKSKLIYSKPDGKYFMQISTQDNLERNSTKSDQKWMVCEEKQAGQLLGGKVTALTPFVLIEDRQKQVKPLVDSRVMEYELVGIELQSDHSMLIISSSDLLIFLRYIEHSPKLVEGGDRFF
ncbi:hypothetical protein FC19_GL002181 [Liquorilactobacillus aquaticus DSM 21051]|uniref:YbaK/aminoacyl-tRNA synthetase-associated domain-containing protein n=1 Tax=Liquorilactobacillus aquaticus DSM 21051 TaxID=1423725 RepID=A0A0R2CTJ5_9LACO|nr:hypothetical protein [Liquorilactobacillus aquaticus]KRM95087.1 hypothetical protein FC19_GL002181 [Liquorilactobacillus aquaticus DSM 21051]